MDKFSSLKVKIVPVGLNYFHGHRFRSHVMVEYGPPIEIPTQLVLEYRKDKRAAGDKLLQLIESRLRDVTLNYPSFHSMQMVTLARRLYQPDIELSADQFINLQRRFASLFVVLRDKPEIIEALEKIEEYDYDLSVHGFKDYEIKTLEAEDHGMYLTLILRAVLLFVIVILSIPGAVLNSPLGLIARFLSNREAKRALSKSEVKVKAQDVLASHKVIVAMAITPIAWTVYFLVFSYMYGWRSGFVFLCTLPFFSYAAIRMLEQGLQIWRSTTPLLRGLWRSNFVETVENIKEKRKALVTMLRQLVKDCVPLMGKEFGENVVITQEMFDEEKRREESRNRKVSSVLGVNRREYKEKTNDAVEDSFMDFASDFDSAKKPVMLATSVEMERLKVFKEAEHEQDDKSPRTSELRKSPYRTPKHK
jgi:glycerol-3-phosphate O-acyltransferase/dihydroxyacetone phosphate acyltransferase